MILLPIMIPVLFGLALLLVAVVAMGTVLFSAVATAIASAGYSLVKASSRKRALARIPEGAVAAATALPETGVTEDWPLAA